MGSERRLVELSHVVGHGTVTYPGLPGPRIADHLTREESRSRYAPGTEFQIGRIELVANTGTYVDAPFHRYPDGGDVASLPLHRLADVEGLCITLAPGRRAISVDLLEGLDVTGKAVLFATGWDRWWATERYGDPEHPFVDAAAAEWLAARDPATVGIDSVNIDDMGDASRPAHTALLAAGIPVVEHLCGLGALPPSGFRLHAAPVAVAGMGTFPVRAYAVVDAP